MVGGPAPKVSIWSLQDRRKKAVPKPWIVRWVVGSRKGGTFTRAFTHKAQAEDLRARLRIAAAEGLRFSRADGLPEAWSKDNPALAAYAARWLDRQWPTWSPRSRVSAVDALVRTLEATVSVKAPRLSVDQANRVRHYLREYLLRPSAGEPSGDERFAADYIARYSIRMQDLDASEVVSLHHILGIGDDGTPLSPNTATRRRTMAKAMLTGAVEEGLLPTLTWPKNTRRQKTKTTESYNPDLVIDEVTFHTLLDHVETDKSRKNTGRYRAYFAVIFYAGLRPSEAAGLQVDDVSLPDTGWGSVRVERTSRREDPAAYRDSTDKDTGPGKTGKRMVPIPPVLVRMLKSHLKQYPATGTAPMFADISAGSRSKLWARMKRDALPAGSKLLDAHPYDLRHSCATLMLKAGVPIPEVARRLGHSPDMLLSVYAGVLEGDEERANDLLDRVWGPRTGP